MTFVGTMTESQLGATLMIALILFAIGVWAGQLFGKDKVNERLKQVYESSQWADAKKRLRYKLPGAGDVIVVDPYYYDEMVATAELWLTHDNLMRRLDQDELHALVNREVDELNGRVMDMLKKRYPRYEVWISHDRNDRMEMRVSPDGQWLRLPDFLSPEQLEALFPKAVAA